MTRRISHVKDAHANGKQELRIDRKMVEALSSYSYVGIFFGVAVAICLGAGWWLDARFHTKPIFTIVGVVLGVVTGFWELYRVSKKALKDQEK